MIDVGVVFRRIRSGAFQSFWKTSSGPPHEIRFPSLRVAADVERVRGVRDHAEPRKEGGVVQRRCDLAHAAADGVDVDRAGDRRCPDEPRARVLFPSA